LTGDAGLAQAIADDWTRAPLDDADRAMLGFCERLTRTPGEMEPADVDALREAGFDDRSIHDIVAVAAYYAFVNRIADGLGVTLEPGWEADEPGTLPRRPGERVD